MELIRKGRYEEAVDLLVKDYVTAVLLNDRYLSSIVFEELYKVLCRCREIRPEAPGAGVLEILDLMRNRILHEAEERGEELTRIEEDIDLNSNVVMSKYATKLFEKSMGKIPSKALDMHFEEYKRKRVKVLHHIGRMKEARKHFKKLTEF